MAKEIERSRRTNESIKQLKQLYSRAKSRSQLDVWRRCKAVLGFLDGKTVIEIARELDTGRSSVYEWLDWYNNLGSEGLKTNKPPGSATRLSPKQEAELTDIIDAGPVAAGYNTGVWTGPMVGNLIQKRFGVRYHNHHIPRLLHRLGFSVQRPRKKLAKADAEAQEYWLRKKFPSIKKSPEMWRDRDVRR